MAVAEKRLYIGCLAIALFYLVKINYVYFMNYFLFFLITVVYFVVCCYCMVE